MSFHRTDRPAVDETCGIVCPHTMQTGLPVWTRSPVACNAPVSASMVSFTTVSLSSLATDAVTQGRTAALLGTAREVALGRAGGVTPMILARALEASGDRRNALSRGD
jgi:hypothetical protein